jgi:hypothetical protein
VTSVVTFYSYKGGVGRTMAVANIAIRLVQKGLRVLAVDWDLEAPGLDRYFRDLAIRPSNSGGGLLDLLLEASNVSVSGKRPDWREYLSSVELDNKQKLYLLACGRQDDEYVSKVLAFDWNSFFQDADGGSFIESLREEWKAEYDVILIDSRTGITDSGGICTIQLPDVLVPVFTTNHQSLDGAKEIATRAQRARQRLAYDRMPLLIFPLPSHYDGRTQYEEARQWLKTFAAELDIFYRDWLPSPYTPIQIIERTKLPYIAYFSFGESLPVLTGGISDPESLGYAYAVAAALISGEFKNAEQIITGGLLPSETPSTAEPRLIHAVRALWKRSLLHKVWMLAAALLIILALTFSLTRIGPALFQLVQPSPTPTPTPVRPNLVSRIESVEVSKSAGQEGVQVFILLSISNSGSPTVVYDYSIKIAREDLEFKGPPETLNGSYMVSQAGTTEKLVIQPQDDIRLKTAEALAQGSKVSGWLLVKLPAPTLTPDDIRQRGTTYTVSFTDATGKQSTPSYEIR